MTFILCVWLPLKFCTPVTPPECGNLLGWYHARGYRAECTKRGKF